MQLIDYDTVLDQAEGSEDSFMEAMVRGDIDIVPEVPQVAQLLASAPKASHLAHEQSHTRHRTPLQFWRSDDPEGLFDKYVRKESLVRCCVLHLRPVCPRYSFCSAELCDGISTYA